MKHGMEKGRFAPSPTGRMHLGNAFAALMSWLCAKAVGGRWILRIEDLDTSRSRPEYAAMIEDDLHWLGLDWDEGGTTDAGSSAPYCQSRRGELYASALEQLRATGRLYPCFCTRADLRAASAPHQSDGRTLYPGTCRPQNLPRPLEWPGRPHSTRLWVADTEVEFTDGVFGPQKVSLPSQCGDFVLRRADGAWAYQLAVVVDDALMGVTQVVRGADLLLSAAQQIYLYRLLGYTPPRFIHLPLMVNHLDIRLSKRDEALSFKELRTRCTPRQIIGALAAVAGQIPSFEPLTAAELLTVFSLDRIPRTPTIQAPYSLLL